MMSACSIMRATWNAKSAANSRNASDAVLLPRAMSASAEATPPERSFAATSAICAPRRPQPAVSSRSCEIRPWNPAAKSSPVTACWS
ncbi:MAG: hypothetical protein HMLKMBBP_01063 [Planctomycetes bacterium]|nr:hypothetical protein [Planctomycetota bacterium]